MEDLLQEIVNKVEDIIYWGALMKFSPLSLSFRIFPEDVRTPTFDNGR